MDKKVFKPIRLLYRDKINLLFRLYLTERKEFMNFVGLASTYENTDVGVSKGSVLGPLLFVIHINLLRNKTSV